MPLFQLHHARKYFPYLNATIRGNAIYYLHAYFICNSDDYSICNGVIIQNNTLAEQMNSSL